MVKKGISKIALIFFLCAVVNLSSLAQHPKYFIITGKILSEIALIENCSVQIIKNNRPALSTQIPKHGRFRLELDYNCDYQLIFTREGYIDKTIRVNTQIAEEIAGRTENFPHFLMAVKFTRNNQADASLLSENEIQQISYSTQNDCFSRVPTIFENQYVEKGVQGIKPQSHETKTRMQVYQVF